MYGYRGKPCGLSNRTMIPCDPSRLPQLENFPDGIKIIGIIHHDIIQEPVPVFDHGAVIDLLAVDIPDHAAGLMHDRHRPGPVPEVRFADESEGPVARVVRR